MFFHLGHASLSSYFGWLFLFVSMYLGRSAVSSSFGRVTLCNVVGVLWDPLAQTSCSLELGAPEMSLVWVIVLSVQW